MAANIPAKLKPAGITPFMVRAVQLESAKPVISYWCYYWVVQQILKKQLHSVDGECLEFTTTIMDKLEQMKTDQAENDAILDDVTGQAYVEQFAQETFDRALRPLKANKVTQQTASTFEAASTFFQLVNIWGQPEPETLEKIKYAKWNAARILKAIKEGNDPNESNPKQEEPKPEEGVSPLDPNDPEVQLINSARPRPATVEDVPDDQGLPRAPISSYSLHATAPVSAPNSPLPPTASVPDPVSPIAPPDVPAQEPGSYFPNAPSATDQSPLDLPSTTSMPPPGTVGHSVLGSPPEVPTPSVHHPPPAPPSVPYASPGAPPSPQDFYHPPPQHQTAPAPPFVPPQQHYIPSQAPSAPHNYHAPYSQPVVPKVVTAPPPRPAQQYGGNSGPTGPTGPYNYDDMAIAQAQKHAKWAISALNFEDVPTAVRELQAALSSLGAR
ncbi:Vta1 like-domain-containing protein [Hypoxylon argillaceum]|nr:Vta1 like-domain-containing protein [Hypoxylon argillaceum]KAI1155516.1 Vta1 like-domain-containing protein [Nemania diffusa]